MAAASWRVLTLLVLTIMLSSASLGLSQGSFAGDGTAVVPNPLVPTPATTVSPAAPACVDSALRSFAMSGVDAFFLPLDACGRPIPLPRSSGSEPATIPAQLDDTWNFILQAPTPGVPSLGVAFAEDTESWAGYGLPYSIFGGSSGSGASAGARDDLATVAYRSPLLLPGPLVAENGSYYGQLSSLTGRPRSVLVSSYLRRDGTYVRGHYRSPPRR